jgi:glucuronate isomerase
LLNSETAKNLYFNYAEKMPICDFHCHLAVEDIYYDKAYSSITELMLGRGNAGDHYKWRIMRMLGIEEKYITGSASDEERFAAWAKTLPNAAGNALYHWTHLELQRYFDIYDTLSPKTASSIYKRAMEKITAGGFTTKQLIKRSNVRVVCTTEDPSATLEYHHKLKEDNESGIRILPAFRPDTALRINEPGFSTWLQKFSGTLGTKIEHYDELVYFLKQRAEEFKAAGGRISDHGLRTVPYRRAEPAELERILRKRIAGEGLTLEETEKFATELMRALAKVYHDLGWMMQLHINAPQPLRASPKTGGTFPLTDEPISAKLSSLLDSMADDEGLPRTLLFSLHNKDYYTMATLMSALQQPGEVQKVGLGPAWWYHDQRDGMVEHMKHLSNVGLLATFVGMTTDSRSLLSYSRHEYFRRVLCNLIGEWVEDGEYPDDVEFLGSMVQDISFNNSIRLFG